MKKLLVFAAILFGLSFTTVNDGVTKKEKETAAKFLADTEQGVLDAVKDLSDAQLKFKPAPDKWGVEECLKHIAATEIGLWQLTEGNLKQAANPEKRADIKMSDEEVMKNIENRTNKVKTFTPFEPQNTSFISAEEAIISFKENRAKLIDYIKNTDADLRNHIAVLPIASFDCYQMILFIGAHSNRHMQQINEVKANPNFPKN